MPIAGMILSSVCLSVCLWLWRSVLWLNDIHPTSKMSEQVNRKCHSEHDFATFTPYTGPALSPRTSHLLNHWRSCHLTNTLELRPTVNKRAAKISTSGIPIVSTAVRSALSQQQLGYLLYLLCRARVPLWPDVWRVTVLHLGEYWNFPVFQVLLYAALEALTLILRIKQSVNLCYALARGSTVMH